ncbi:MAG TPA: biotin/lipoyl-containing protein, partial [Caldimonas sp.]|nr:biotin/lipoyl-containing protein [Caldimonas sp.]
MALVDIKVPDIGDFKDVEVIEVLVKPGDRIAPEQSLVTVESDKASMEIPASQGGVVKEMRVKLGDKVSEGSVVLTLESEGGGGGDPPAKTQPSELAPATAAASAPAAPAAASPAPSPLPAPVGGAAVTVAVPDIGDFKDVAVIEVMVKPGDTVQAEQSLITVESDKASMEIPSSQAGVVKEVLVRVGDKVSEGSPVVRLEAAASAAMASAPAPAAAAAAPSPPPPTPAPGAAPPAHAERTSPTAALPAHEPSAPTGALPHA